jgi:hypothetical protein
VDGRHLFKWTDIKYVRYISNGHFYGISAGYGLGVLSGVRYGDRSGNGQFRTLRGFCNSIRAFN